MSHNQGIIFDIQRFCVHDGPGIRTSVFLKGCMMRCIWCHNPESFSSKIQLSYESETCTGCQSCQSVCSEGVHSFCEGVHRIAYENCIGCGKCIDICVAGSLKLFGKMYTAEEVITEICKDRAYYQESGGGVTFTGGEPTLQFDFLMELVTRCKQEKISVCIETNGVISNTRLSALAEYTDLFLLDYKATGKAHKRLTGIEEGEVLPALEFLDRIGKPIVLRCPIIQGLNDDDEHFAAIRSLQNTYSSIRKVEIMAYHAIGRQKWEAIGKEYSLNHLESATNEQKKLWERKLDYR